MENKHYPEQEPDLMPAAPASDGDEDILIIEDLNFADPPEIAPAAEEIFYPEEPPAQAPALMDTDEIPALDCPTGELPVIPVSLFPEEEPAYVAGETEMPAFAEALPAVPEAEIPQEPDDPVMEILSNPEFSMPQPPAAPEEETVDQEYRDALPEPQPEEPAAAGKKKKKADNDRPTLKGRPKRKKGEGLFGIPNILVTFVWLALILAIGVTLGRMLWVCAADVLAFGRPDQKVTITVYEADTMEDVIDKLHANGLIRYKSLFSLYADISDAEEDIKPGIYDLNTRYDYHALVNFMSPSSTREVIKLTIPEGYTCRQIFALLEENRVCTAQDIAAYAADGALSDYWFLEDVVRGSEYCLEGFLFPDTYQFYKNSSPREALEKMLDNFDHRFSEEMRAQIETLNANVTGGGYGVREIVIVASLIEKESAAPAESATIASVIYNRLHNWDYPALLNIDAAIVYAQGGEADTIDTGIDSPYNTYRYTGLTPTPIANPGLSSLKAALNPETTDYYFYVLNPSTGMHQFSKTQAEHDGWINEFYN